MNYLIFMIGTGVGAVSRFKTTNCLKKYDYGILATFIVNMLGCFIAGWLIHLIATSFLALLVLGFIGGFTTFSTFNSEVANFIFAKQNLNAFTYLLVSYLLGFTLCVLGYLIV